MSKVERAKGARGELEVVHLFRECGWPDATRTSDGRGQGQRGDIARGPAGCHFEVKRVERLNVPRALRQIEADANPLDIPILIHRPSRADWCATLPLSELLPLLQFREQAT